MRCLQRLPFTIFHIQSSVLCKARPLAHVCQDHLHVLSQSGKDRYEAQLNVTSLRLSLHSVRFTADTKRHLSSQLLQDALSYQSSWFLWLSCSWPVEQMMDMLKELHQVSHLPWWSSIILATFIMRGVTTFPIAVYQHYISAKIETIKPEMKELAKGLSQEVAYAVKLYGWDEKYARYMFTKNAKRLWNELVIRENCHPFKTFLMLWIQIPLWIVMSVALRNMTLMWPHQDTAAQILFLELSVGGIAWFPNLTEVDHSFILPVTMGLLNLAITEILQLHKGDTVTRFSKVVTNFFRVVSIAFIPLACFLPTAVNLYWVTSSACALGQNLLLLSPRVRRFFRIPPTSLERPQPYRFIWQNFLKRFKR